MNRGNKESKLKGARAKPKTSGPRNQPRARVAEERSRARALARVETAKKAGGQKSRPTSMATADEQRRIIRAVERQTGTPITMSERERVLKILGEEVGGR